MFESFRVEAKKCEIVCGFAFVAQGVNRDSFFTIERARTPKGPRPRNMCICQDQSVQE